MVSKFFNDFLAVLELKTDFSLFAFCVFDKHLNDAKLLSQLIRRKKATLETAFSISFKNESTHL